jgi:hypothetical protein
VETIRELTQLHVLTLDHGGRRDSIGLGIHWFGAPSSLECLYLAGHGPWIQQGIERVAEHLPRLDVLEYDSNKMDATLLSWLKKSRPDVYMA